MKACEFINYYKMQETEVPETYIQQFIDAHNIDESQLAEINWDTVVKNHFNHGICYGQNIANIINGPDCELSLKDAKAKIEKVIVSIKLLAESDEAKPVYLILERAEKMLYFSTQPVFDNYGKSEFSKNIGLDEVNHLIDKLTELVDENKEEVFTEKRPEYEFKIVYVLNDKSVKRFLGDSEEKNRYTNFDAGIRSIIKDSFDKEF